MKKPFFLVLIALASLCISCSNDDNSVTVPEENFFALKVGNSWVYEHFRRENQVTPVYNSVSVIDSVKIVGTEIIDGNEFFKYRIRTSGNENNISFCSPNGERFEYLRDSIGYLVNQFGKVRFSREDNQEFLVSDGAIYPVYTRRTENIEMITTAAGEFECEYMEVYARMPPNGDLLPGLDKKYYTDGIGNVMSTLSFASDPIPVIERRLISYDIQ